MEKEEDEEAEEKEEEDEGEVTSYIFPLLWTNIFYRPGLSSCSNLLEAFSPTTQRTLDKRSHSSAVWLQFVLSIFMWWTQNCVSALETLIDCYGCRIAGSVCVCAFSITAPLNHHNFSPRYWLQLFLCKIYIIFMKLLMLLYGFGPYVLCTMRFSVSQFPPINILLFSELQWIYSRRQQVGVRLR